MADKHNPNPNNNPVSYPPAAPDKTASTFKYVVFGLIGLAAVVVLISLVF